MSRSQASVNLWNVSYLGPKQSHSGGSKGCMREIIKSAIFWRAKKATDRKWTVPSFSTNSIWEGLVYRNSSGPNEEYVTFRAKGCLADLNDQTSQSRPEKLLFYLTISPWLEKNPPFNPTTAALSRSNFLHFDLGHMAVHRLNHRLGNFYNLLLNCSALEKDSMKGFSKNLHSDKENDCLGLPSTHENLEDRSVTCQYMTLGGGKQLAPSHSSQASTWCTWGCSTIRSCSWTWRVQWRMRRNLHLSAESFWNTQLLLRSDPVHKNGLLVILVLSIQARNRWM